MILLNPDEEFVKEMLEQIKANSGHCPCVIPEIRSEDTKCMCKEFREMDDGECRCGLYTKREVLLDEFYTR